MKKAVLFYFIFFISSLHQAQTILHPGFDAKEYMDLLRVSSQHLDSLHPEYVLPIGSNYKKIYRSPVVGLQNRFDIWLKDSSIGIISIRATVASNESWLENFYIGMIASQGSISIHSNQAFTYKIAADTNAYVHLGWMLGLAYMAPDIVLQINKLYQKGIKQFIIMGHSQGGAIAFLLRSYLEYLDEKELPKDILFKTYCSAPPKPGNLFYSYDFDYITRNGWAFRVINKLDWVPEPPFTVQTSQDVNTISPMRNKDQYTRRLSFAAKFYLKSIYRKLDRSTLKSLKLYQRYLGHKVYKWIKKHHSEYTEPAYKASINYTIAGSPVILMPDTNYLKSFPEKGQNPFLHHSYKSYLFLTEKNYQP